MKTTPKIIRKFNGKFIGMKYPARKAAPSKIKIDAIEYARYFIQSICSLVID